MALSTIGEGCHQQMEYVLDPVISGIINYLNDVVSPIMKRSLKVNFVIPFYVKTI